MTNRVDVAAPAGAAATGTVSFTHSGDAPLSGILSSEQPWLIPQSGTVTIAPGETSSFSFTVDRTTRLDADSLLGSASGSVSLAYLNGSLPSLSRVSIVDTVQLPLTVVGPPPLAGDEVALFVPGVGHVPGTVGTFVSDISLTPVSNQAIDDMRTGL